MPEPNGEATGTGTNDDGWKAEPISRRRWMKLAAAGVVGGSVAVGRAAAGADDHPNTIVFDGTVSSGKSKYAFSVSGSVHAHGDTGPLEVKDTIDGSSVTGAVHRDTDAYRFSGNLTSLDVKGDAAVSVTYGDDGDVAADRLEIVAGADASVDYSFTASDRITPVTDRDTNPAESDDTVAENDDGSWTATGSTDSGTGDTFDFWGDVTDFAPMDGDYTLFLNGSEVTAYDLTGEEPPSDSTTHTLEIHTPSDGSVEYTMTTTGEIRKVLDNGDLSAEEQNDTVTQNDDGTWTVTGLTGNGYGDTFEFDGEATAFDPMEGTYTLYLDGTEVTAYELTGQEPTAKTLEIVTPEDGSVEYTFTTTGELSKVLDNGDNSAEEDNDTVTQNSDGTWTATGLTGNGYGDTYEFYGDVTAFDPKEGTFGLYLDGTQVTAYELTGTEPTDDSTTDTSGGSTDGSVLGGGQGYANTVSRDSATVEVTSASGLDDALASASSGDVVYVPGNVEMDVGDTVYTVPDGVTLASNRGIDDAPGALLYTDQEPDECFSLEGTARFTGLRLKGPHPGDDLTGDSGAGGVQTLGAGEVDNCDVWGFSHHGIQADSGGDAHIHHNVIRENNKSGLGYGVDASSGNPVIEYNYFNFNRHSIATGGGNYGYVARYNHFGPELTDTPVDAHDPAGTHYEVHNNVVEGYVPTADRFEGTTHQCVQFRGVPDDVANVDDNWFWNPNLPEPGTWGGYSIIQPHSDSFENVEFSGNYYGEDASVTFSDVIAGYDGWRSP